jgi:hypothetical protein
MNAAAGGGGGPAFDPTTVANMVAWYDASDASTITESSGNVTQWDDKSGEANHMSPISTTIGVTSTRTINGLNAIDLQSNASHGGLTGTWTAGTLTIFIVFITDSATSGYLCDGPGSANRSALYFSSGPSYGANWGGGGNTGGTPDTSKHIVEMRGGGPGGLEEVYVDGGSAVISGQESPLDSVAQLRIGRAFVDGFNFDGVIGEILAYRFPPSLSDRNDILDYLAGKWGITTTAYS